MNNEPFVVQSHDVQLNAEYTQWIHEIKQKYRSTQIKAAVKVNAEQLMFNWTLGRDLVVKKAEEKWGAGIVEQVSIDLKSEFPSAKGFSTTNLWNMKKWYLFYSNNLQQLVGESLNDINAEHLNQIGNNSSAKLQQAVGEIDLPTIFTFVQYQLIILR